MTKRTKVEQMKERMLAKLRSRSGESIAETLLALLVSALAMMMLAGAVSSAAKVITQSNLQMARYYKQDNALATRTSGANTIVTIEGKGISENHTVQYYTNSVFAGVPVVAYSESAGGATGNEGSQDTSEP